MSLINLTLEHGRTLEEARRHLETAVHQVSAQFGSVVRRVEWEADRVRFPRTRGTVIEIGP